MLIVFGLGYVGSRLSAAARASGWNVAGTVRSASPERRGVMFEEVGSLLPLATHLLSTVPPDEAGDPVLARYGQIISAAPNLRWIGYLSTTGVYGDRCGGWVTEETIPSPLSERSRWRLESERKWTSLADRRAVDLFRLAGIYGPGRSPLDVVREESARIVIRPGHKFNRIHRDDVVQAALAAMGQALRPGIRVLNIADDEPAENATVIAEAARLLGVSIPIGVPFAEAWVGMSEMARSFWAENRLVSSQATKAVLGITWYYPSYREGLRSILRIVPQRAV